MKSKYYILYVDGCSPQLKEFKSQKDRDKWALEYLLKSQGDEDSWIDIVFDGQLSYKGFGLREVS